MGEGEESREWLALKSGDEALTVVERHLGLFLKLGEELYLIVKSNGAQFKQLRVFNKSVNSG